MVNQEVRKITCYILIGVMWIAMSKADNNKVNRRIEELLSKMTLAEKVGQMSQFNGFGGRIPEEFKQKLREGLVGSVLNETDPRTINEMQRLAVEESRLGIPLLIGRDVIHGFKTILPIPLGQAAAWNPELIEEGARMAATEARSQGINWTFAPMIDVTRDPRWGRIAESLGEDPYLTSVLGAAMIRGFQGKSLKAQGSIAACAKHFAGYGAAEGGRDYNTASIPENELRDVYLPPFKAAVEQGVATFMSAFNELNGVPTTGNEFLTRQILREEWKFKGFVVSDWESVIQQVVHGHTVTQKEAAAQAIRAGVDMEMASTSYADYIPELIKQGSISIELIDAAVRNILNIKFQMDLFEQPYTQPEDFAQLLNDQHRSIAKKIAVQSIVLLQNKNNILPLKSELKRIAVIGPLADAPHDQLGTWIFNGDKSHSVTPLQSLREFPSPKYEIRYCEALPNSRDKNRTAFGEALSIAKESDVILLFLGEESILSGESHCRADLSLPGAQEALVEKLHEAGKPIVAVILAGRPLTFRNILNQVDAVLYAWHPGTMAGPAISDILFGITVPSGKLPVTFPTVEGQIPMYYAHKNTGRPPTPESWTKMDDIPEETFQLSVGNTSHYLDEGYEPLFPFGFGLSYTTFEYKNITLDKNEMKLGDRLTVTAEVSNTGNFEGEEVVQLYVRDLFADRTRPVRELKGFKRLALKKGESQTVSFEISTEKLAFHNRRMEYVTEPGKFKVWIGSNSRADLDSEFTIIE